MKTENKKGFTLIELLVVISIIALLLAVLMPALSVAKSQTKAVICKSNARQLTLANITYAQNNSGYYVPASTDIYKNKGGFHRWHGTRCYQDEPFDPLEGPLSSYLGSGKVKECPERIKFIKGNNWNTNYEQGAGGYGYNATFIGGRHWEKGLDFEDPYKKTTHILEVAKPSETLMFADCAISKDGASYIETSFAWQPYIVYAGKELKYFMSPTIHFRHRQKASIAWCDGHVDSRKMADFDDLNVFNVQSAEMMLGWFNPLDNSLFDLK